MQIAITAFVAGPVSRIASLAYIHLDGFRIDDAGAARVVVELLAFCGEKHIGFLGGGFNRSGRGGVDRGAVLCLTRAGTFDD